MYINQKGMDNMEYEDYEELVRGNVLAGKLTGYLNSEYETWVAHMYGNCIEVFISDRELEDLGGCTEDNIFDATFYAYDYILCQAGYDLTGETIYFLMDSGIIEVNVLTDIVKLDAYEPAEAWTFSRGFKD